MPFPCPYCRLSLEQASRALNAVCPRCGRFFLLPAAGSDSNDAAWRRAIACQLGIVLVVAACRWIVV